MASDTAGDASTSSLRLNNDDGISAQSSVKKRPYAKGDRSAKACDICHQRKTRCTGNVPCQFCLSRGLVCSMSGAPPKKKDKLDLQSQPEIEWDKGGQEVPSYLGMDGNHPRSSSDKSRIPGTIRSNSNNLGSPSSPSFLGLLNDQSDASRIFHPIDHSPHTTAVLPLPSNLRSPQITNPHTFPPPLWPTSPPAIGRGSFHSPNMNVLPHPLVYSGASSSAALPSMPPASHTIPQAVALHTSPGAASSISLNSSVATPALEGEHSVSGAVLTRFQRPPPALAEPDIPSLVDRRSSIRFFDSYFFQAEFIYQLWPLPEIISLAHEVVWEYPSSPQKTIPLGQRTTLAALLALGAFFEKRIEDSERLYQAARSSYLDVIELGTLESVQLALQMAMFEINTQRSSSLWSTLAVAIRLCHSLNLHRRPPLRGKSPEEKLRRCQLFFCAFNHDLWLSMSTGRPCLVTAGDSDLPEPWLKTYDEDGTTVLQLISGPVFATRVRLSALWLTVHERLYSNKNESATSAKQSAGNAVVGGSSEVTAEHQQAHWLEALSELSGEFSSWENDMALLEPAIASDRKQKKQHEAIKCAGGTMKLIMHRSFLIKRGIQSPSDEYRKQRQVSEGAALDGAMQIIDSCHRLVSLDLSMSFWFLAVSLQIACLALCELQSNSGAESNRPQEGLKLATALLEEISQSGNNQAASQVLEAVRSIQDAWSVSRLPAEPTPVAGNSQYDQTTSGDTTQMADGFDGAFNNGTIVSPYGGFAGAGDFDWLTSFQGNNVLDSFVGNGPASESLAWWLNPLS